MASLAARVTALAQAIGADIKALKASAGGAASYIRSLLAPETPSYRAITNAVLHNSNTYLRRGSLKITLPTGIVAGDTSTGSATFVSLRFRLWEYGGRGTCWVTIDGYLQANGSPAVNVWSNVSAYIETLNRNSKPIRVRFGMEGQNYVLLIEKTTTGTDSDWLYLMLALESAHLSNSGANSTRFDDPTTWKVEYPTDLSSISFYTTVTPAAELLTSDVQGSVTDKTAGKLMTVGAFGLGGILPTVNNSNIDDPTLVCSTYQVTRTIYSVFPQGFVKGTFQTQALAVGSSTGNAYHVLTDTSTSTPRKWERTMVAGVCGTWAETSNSANLSKVNELKNGDVSVNSLGNAAPPDRFGVGAVSGSSNLPVSGRTLIGTSEAVPFGLKRWWTLATYDGGIFLVVPNVRRYAGRTMTFSFYAKADKAGASMSGLRFYQRFGTGGNPSATTSSYGTSDGLTLTTAVQRLVCTVTLPDLNGKVLGTNDDSDLYISMNFALGGATISLTGFKFEGGVAATPFEMRDEESILMGAAGLSKYFESPQLTLTGGGKLTIAHGLVAIPKLLNLQLLCVSDALGFVAGERLLIAPHVLYDAPNSGNRMNIIHTITFDGTNIYVFFSNRFYLQDKSTATTNIGEGTYAVTNNFKLIIGAAA